MAAINLTTSTHLKTEDHVQSGLHLDVFSDHNRLSPSLLWRNSSLKIFLDTCMPPSPSPSTPSSRPIPKPKRVLACVLCQQRKIKCDRRFPCANCTKTHEECVPATLAPRQRRRRFPERDLLERLRQYESLLRHHNIHFLPLHSTDGESKPTDAASPDDEQSDISASRTEGASPEATVKSEPNYETKNFWRAINQHDEFSDEEEIDDNIPRMGVRQGTIRKAWDQLFDNNDHLLFGAREENIDLSTLHPEQAKIFKLWQVYLDNVNPLLKVTHTPTLQSHIIEAMSNVINLTPPLEALLFSIYCISIESLAENECQDLFQSTKKNILKGYQFGCQQALLNCEVLRSNDRQCLTALFLYLVSARSYQDPRAISSMLGLAMRIANRIGIHNESLNVKYSPFEAEMRRRLWWALVCFDSRISEMSDHNCSTLAPTWNCQIPLNANDFDLVPEMTSPPAIHQSPTEALFAVVRSKFADFVRHSSDYLDFTNPALKAIAKETQYGLVLPGEALDKFEEEVEKEDFRLCNPENSLHFMTIWMMRGLMAKYRLLEQFSRLLGGNMQQNNSQRDATIPHALSLLECDTKLASSSLISRFSWFIHLHFPFPAYIYLIQDLKVRPMAQYAAKAWQRMTENFDAHFEMSNRDFNPVFDIFFNTVMQAWEAREAVRGPSDEKPPGIINSLRRIRWSMNTRANTSLTDQTNALADMTFDDVPMPSNISGSEDSTYMLGGQEFMGSLAVPPGFGNYPQMADPGPIDGKADQSMLDWTTIDWNALNLPGL